MTTHYTLTDLQGIASAFFLFPALTVFPGYLLAYFFNIWEFRLRTTAFQVAASIALSIGVGPILTLFTGPLAWPLYFCIAATAIVVILRSQHRFDKTIRIATLVGLGWSVFGALWLMDWQFGSRVYFPTYALDYSTRAAMVHSLSLFGLPAQTPFLNPGHPVALHYHFLWLLQCSLIPGSSRLAFVAGAIWCGIGLMCVAALAMRILMQKRSWIVVGLLAVTGLDIMPALLLLATNRMHLVNTLPPSVEWWNDQVDGFLYTVLWEPHYICALIACVTGFLLMWQSRRLASIVLAALCFATAVGSGSFVALVFAAFLAVWMLADWRSSATHFAITGLLTVVFSMPYLMTLRGSATNVGGSFLQLTVRAFSPFPMPLWVNLMVLPLNYFLELGFFAACVWVGYRRKLEKHERALFLMAFTAIVVCTFVKSGATPNNDLGWRGFLVAQFALLILSAAYLEAKRPALLLRYFLLLGLVGTAYDLTLTRLFPILSDANLVPKLKWLALDQQLGERTLANREAYAWLQHHSNPSAILAQNPDVAALDLFSGLYADRRVVAGDRTCTTGFGGTAAECQSVMPALLQFFRGRSTLAQACQVLPADFYVVKDTDPAWAQAWEPAAYSNRFVRIYDCKSGQR